MARATMRANRTTFGRGVAASSLDARRAGPKRSVPCHALSDRVSGGLLAAAVTLSASLPVGAEEVMPVYFGNGCFWGRQKDFVDTEMAMGRNMGSSTAIVGYAGGMVNEKSTCYYYNMSDTLYERQGHAEVVQVALDSGKAQDDFALFAETYFAQFNKTRFGMARQDPQDKGPGYRNVVGIPGGVDSELFKVLQEKNKNNMKLVRGYGNSMAAGRATEDDVFNTVFVVDSNALPFHQAELYHQYHNGMVKNFPVSYLVDMKKAKLRDGTIKKVPDCMEYPF